jgi:hypothetical protein
MPEYDVFLHPRTRVHYHVVAESKEHALQQAFSLYERTDESDVYLPVWRDVFMSELFAGARIDEFIDPVEELRDTAIISP